jgi:glycosyltransferase involved in cell wall biosynthesis
MASVTVVIPIYNGEQLIRETLDSIFNQTYADYEVICVDDSSTDSSISILNEYRDRILIVQQTNAGQAKARNTGAKHGTGKYLAFLDQDDRWYPHFLERHVAILEKNPDAVMVHCDMDWIDEIGNVICRSVSGSIRRTSKEKLTMTKLVGWDPNVLPSTMLLRRSAFDRVNGFDPELRCGEDIELLLRLHNEGRFMYVGEPGTQYRKHTHNFSGSGSDAMFLCTEKLFRKLQIIYVADEAKQRVLDQFLAKTYSDWGKMKIRHGSRREAQCLLIRSLRHYPWKLSTYSRLIRSILPKWALRISSHPIQAS